MLGQLLVTLQMFISFSLDCTISYIDPVPKLTAPSCVQYGNEVAHYSSHVYSQKAVYSYYRREEVWANCRIGHPLVHSQSVLPSVKKILFMNG